MAAPAEPRSSSPAVIEPASRRDATAGLYPWYVLGVLFVVYVFNFIDRNILSILAQDIKTDLGLSDVQLGFLYGTAFAIFYSLLGVPLGRLTDSWYRARLIAAGLALWSAMTALSGLASSFAQMSFARVGVGIGEASASPAAYSLLCDYFSPRRRSLALAIYSSGLFVGAGLSLPLGGWVAHTWSNAYPNGSAPFGLAGWQAAFLAVGLPGLVLALWVLTLREPPRGLAEGHIEQPRKPAVWRAFGLEVAAILPPFTLWSVSRFGARRANLLALVAIASVAAILVRITHDSAQWIGLGISIYAVTSWLQMLRAADAPTFAVLFGHRAIIFALLGFGATAFVSYSLGFWIAPYAMRTFGIRADVAGFMLGVPQAFGAAAGCAAGGYLSDAWKRRDPRGRIFVVMLASILSGPLVIAALHATTVRIVYLINPLVAFTASLWVGSAAATIQDCVLPRMRGTAGAIFLLAVSILGLALGPYSVGKVAALTGSLRTGILSLLGMMPVALLLLWTATRRIGVAEESRSARARAAGEKA